MNGAKLDPVDFAKDALETLRSVAFPVYAVSPSEWHGDVMVGGMSGNKNHPISIEMRYDDDLSVERPSRRIEITSTGPEGLSKRAPSDSFLLWQSAYETEIANFVNNISPVQLVRGAGAIPDAGPRRLIDTIPFREGFHMERVEFDHHPELALYRIKMPATEVLIMGWGWDDDRLAEFAISARSMQGDDDLFAEIERAEYAAWEKIRQRKQRSHG